LLENENVLFDVVGPILISASAVKSAPANLAFHGSASRDRVAEWYGNSDLFVLPTLSDGFALTQLEAMSHGLPLIVTPNCGRVVEEGVTGFIVPPRNAQALAGALLRFINEPDLARNMRQACLASLMDYSISTFGTRLVNMTRQHKMVDRNKS